MNSINEGLRLRSIDSEHSQQLNYFVQCKLNKTFNREVIKCCKEEEAKQNKHQHIMIKKKTCTVDSIKALSSLRETQQTSTPLLDPIGKTEKRKEEIYKYINIYKFQQNSSKNKR